MKPRITRGADFSIYIQVTTEPYASGLFIDSSAAGEPSVVTTALPHKLVDNDRVRITGHIKNTIVNGTNTATVLDQFRFSVPVVGAEGGINTGRVSKVSDISGYAITASVKDSPNGTELTTGTVTIINGTDGIYRIEIPNDRTTLITTSGCVIVVQSVDVSAKIKIVGIECEVVDA